MPEWLIEKINRFDTKYKIKTADKQIVRMQAYNQLADFAYSKLNTNDKVFINGYIEANVVKVKCINVWK